MYRNCPCFFNTSFGRIQQVTHRVIVNNDTSIGKHVTLHVFQRWQNVSDPGNRGPLTNHSWVDQIIQPKKSSTFEISSHSLHNHPYHPYLCMRFYLKVFRENPILQVLPGEKVYKVSQIEKSKTPQNEGFEWMDMSAPMT